VAVVSGEAEAQLVHILSFADNSQSSCGFIIRMSNVVHKHSLIRTIWARSLTCLTVHGYFGSRQLESTILRDRGQ
jgi:hypothetical protein